MSRRTHVEYRVEYAEPGARRWQGLRTIIDNEALARQIATPEVAHDLYTLPEGVRLRVRHRTVVTLTDAWLPLPPVLAGSDTEDREAQP